MITELLLTIIKKVFLDYSPSRKLIMYNYVGGNYSVMSITLSQTDIAKIYQPVIYKTTLEKPFAKNIEANESSLLNKNSQLYSQNQNIIRQELERLTA